MYKPKYLVITPVRDEEAYIAHTIESMIAQTMRPHRWVIVDDGSTDRTCEIISDACRKNPWISILKRRNRGYRRPGGGVIMAFYAGYGSVASDAWDFIVKLDGDLIFERYYFEKCFEKFARENRLGIGGGTVYAIKNGKEVIDSNGDPPFHVRGATKIYKKECWNAISPLLMAPGWDTVDEVKANMFGWTTRTFKDVCLTQLKATGSAEGGLQDCYKNGVGSCIAGYHPFFMLARCVRRMPRKPYLCGSVALWCGFCAGYVKGVHKLRQLDVIHYLRRQQLRRLFLKHSIYG